MINPTHIRVFYFDNLNTIINSIGINSSSEYITDIPIKLKEKYYPNKIFTDVGLSGITYEEFVVVDNCIPNNIRKTTLHGIKGTDSSIIDLNKVCDQDIYNYKEAINDSLISAIRYTDYSDSKPLNRYAYAKFNDGHLELIVNVNQSPEVSSSIKRPILVVVEEYDESSKTYNYLIGTSDTHKADVGLKLENNSAMMSSSCKIIRFIIQLGDDETNNTAKVRHYYNVFNDIDLGILEILTVFDESLDQKINSVKAKELIDQYGLKDNLGEIRSTNGTILTIQDEFEL